MATADTYVRARIGTATKERAADALEDMVHPAPLHVVKRAYGCARRIRARRSSCESGSPGPDVGTSR